MGYLTWANAFLNLTPLAAILLMLGKVTFFSDRWRKSSISITRTFLFVSVAVAEHIDTQSIIKKQFLIIFVVIQLDKRSICWTHLFSLFCESVMFLVDYKTCYYIELFIQLRVP